MRSPVSAGNGLRLRDIDRPGILLNEILVQGGLEELGRHVLSNAIVYLDMGRGYPDRWFGGTFRSRLEDFFEKDRDQGTAGTMGPGDRKSGAGN